jgi:molybdate transport repressor ModE-like protein
MNLNALRLFAAVVEHGGFSRAAEAVHVSQPAVSKAVGELERKAGVPLLERGGRGGRGVRLTEAGEALYARARRIFSEERAAEEELRARRGVELGTLRIGASTTIATYLLPELLATFDRRHPGVELRVASLNTRAVVERLLAYELDVALVEGPVRATGVEVSRWREDQLEVIAPAAHRLAGRRGVEAAELAAERFLVREPGSGTRAVSEAALAALGVAPARTLELGSTEAIKRAVAAGLGVAIVSRAALEVELDLGTLSVLAVEGVEITRPLSRLWLSGRPPSRAARAFEALLSESPP